MPWLFLLAYTCSGLAGLIYEVSWTRLLTLYIGHTTAAASAVVGGVSRRPCRRRRRSAARVAARLTRRQSLVRIRRARAAGRRGGADAAVRTARADAAPAVGLQRRRTDGAVSAIRLSRAW